MSIDGGMVKDDVVHIYNGILAIKNEIMPFVAKWMNLEIVILHETSFRQRKKIIRYCLCVESKKMI